MIERYSNLITQGGGTVHRSEDWGRRQLAYPINKIFKAHYAMLNIECGLETLDELTESCRFNDGVLRNMVMGRKQADTEVSPIMKLENESRERKERDEARAARQAAQQESEAAQNAEAASSEADAPAEENAASEQEEA
jgi:small subunit ribosomal protein S6